MTVPVCILPACEVTVNRFERVKSHIWAPARGRRLAASDLVQQTKLIHASDAKFQHTPVHEFVFTPGVYQQVVTLRQPLNISCNCSLRKNLYWSMKAELAIVDVHGIRVHLAFYYLVVCIH